MDYCENGSEQQAGEIFVSKAILSSVLFWGIGVPCLTLFCVTWLYAFSFCSILTPSADIVLGMVLMLSAFCWGFGSQCWHIWLFSRPFLTRRWIWIALFCAMFCAGALWVIPCLCGSAWETGGFYYYPGALVPTIYRRNLWQHGNFIWIAITTLYFFFSWFLPLAVGMRIGRGGTWAMAVAFCSVIAVVIGILALGMIAEPFKYFSLSASCDWSSPQWEFPYVMESMGAAIALFATVATVCRIVWFFRLAGQPFSKLNEYRRQLVRNIKCHLIIDGIFLLLTIVGALLYSGVYRGNVLLKQDIELYSPMREALLEIHAGLKDKGDDDTPEARKLWMLQKAWTEYFVKDNHSALKNISSEFQKEFSSAFTGEK